MAENDLLLQTLQRIETKVDSAVVNHAERLSALETGLVGVKEDLHDEKVVSWIKLGGTYLAVMASHLGLNKIGWKI